ncbi:MULTISPECIES: TIM-barrel domain-containing protein [unclassified Curtobacterium]|uniref:glycoside hydrolase family 31 protein n=1 Tax=unclassified Curtobacterium TaxID=257496 RepID=UPI000DA6DE2A|nr:MULTISPECIES: TIM-barrel domain-containing protein [unclassified Curtobacterium]PZE66097.1 glycoside hydrolase [Curtobacterium sp. MCLR17_059]PZF54045.1 glycoside hydrolase [Curtobacterium sp. MCLR17_057]
MSSSTTGTSTTGTTGTTCAVLPTIRPFPGSDPVADPAAVVTGDHWRITVLDAGAFRIEWSDDGGFEDRASTFAMRRRLPVPAFTVERTAAADGTGTAAGVVVVTTDRAHLRYDGRPFSPSGLVVETTGPDANRWRWGQEPRDLGGTGRTLDDVDGRMPLEPGILARDGITALDDSESFLFADDGWIGTRVPGRRDVTVFAYGRDYDAALRTYHAVSGPPSRMPRWALGNWWSRYHPYSDTSYLELLDRFAAEHLPFSVAVIDMDWHRVDSVPPRFGNGWTGYSWEPSLFPDPEAFLAELHRRGMRTTLNLHPADGVRAFEDAYPAVARAMGVDPETEQPIAFDPTDRRFLQAYFEQLHRPLEEQGVDFWWIDWQQGRETGLPGVDPLWLLNHFHLLDSARHAPSGGDATGDTTADTDTDTTAVPAPVDGMTFSRYAGPGSHRYAVGFSGDAVVSWASLAFQPEFTATAANIGYPWWSHDIGGHTRGVRDDELATRWVQFGVFSPIMRLHSANNPFIRKEPWAFPAEARAAMGEALRFRHRLVPYLHTMNHGTAEGTALVRPLYHLEPRRDEAYRVPNTYAFGSELLVAPIVAPRDPVSRHGVARAWLPPGTWTDVFTGRVYAGDRFVDLHRTLDTVPVLLRAGGILPLAAADQLDATVNPTAFEVLVAPGAAGEFTLVEDHEGEGSRTARTRLTWDPENAEFRVHATTGALDVVPAHRDWRITFLAAPADGQPTSARSADRFSVDVSVDSASGGSVTLVGAPVVGVDAREAVRRVLEGAQAGNPEKLEAWEVVAKDLPRADRIVELGTVGLPDALRDVVVELLGSVHPGESAPAGR